MHTQRAKIIILLSIECSTQADKPLGFPFFPQHALRNEDNEVRPQIVYSNKALNKAVNVIVPEIHRLNRPSSLVQVVVARGSAISAMRAGSAPRRKLIR